MWQGIIPLKYDNTKEMVMDNVVIKPGDSNIIQISAGKLPSGTKINVAAHVFRSKYPGPTVLIIGGIHGDEINGIEIVRKSIVNNVFSQLGCGSLVAIPLLNVYGFNNFSREMSDGKDINRSFPGHFNGSLASRIARIVTKKILPHIDLAIDFHTGGASRYNYPQIRYYKKDKLASWLAHNSNAPFLLEQSLISQSFRKASFDLSIPTLVYEGGESLRFDAFAINKGMEVVSNILGFLDMIPKREELKLGSINISKSKWVRASAPGIFYWYKKAGDYVKKGDLLGVVYEPTGHNKVDVVSKDSGFIIGHNNTCVISLGDALFHLGTSYENIRLDS